jgi:uridine kinase
MVLAGPSGSGKSRLAGRLHSAYGWPIVRLDDFYRDGDDPDLPKHDTLGIPDWDDPRSWHQESAVRALVELVDNGCAQIPEYDLATSRATGSHEVLAAREHLIVAEGIFAAEAINDLRDAGVLHSAWCITQGRTVTFVRRLVRDLAERRKSPRVLVQRGWALRAAEPEVVARQVALGATCARPSDVEALVAPRSPALG